MEVSVDQRKRSLIFVKKRQNVAWVYITTKITVIDLLTENKSIGLEAYLKSLIMSGQKKYL